MAERAALGGINWSDDGLPRRRRRAHRDRIDLVDHQLVFSNPLGTRIVLPLLPRPLRAFTELVMDALDQLGVRVVINPITVEVPNPTRCDEDAGFDSYDPEVANRFFRILARVETVLETFRASFWGKQTRVGFCWGTFDLAVTRINLRPVEPGVGMGVIRRVAADAEQAEVGFWPGSERYPKPAFYAFTYPSPAGIEDAHIDPVAASWSTEMGEFLLDYDVVRAAADPAHMILAFAESTYAAGAERSGWDRTLLERRPPD